MDMLLHAIISKLELPSAWFTNGRNITVLITAFGYWMLLDKPSIEVEHYLTCQLSKGNPSKN